MTGRPTSTWSANRGEPAPPAAPAPEPTPSEGWDLLDDYQLGKDVAGADAAQTARIARGMQADPAPPAPEPRPGTRTVARTTRFWRQDGSAAQDAEVMARIMARGQAETEIAGRAAERAATAREQEARDLVRQRQRREIEDYVRLQGRRADGERRLGDSLQAMLQEAADIFLALGICPDHLEYLPDLGRFCSWGGRLYDHQELFALRDPQGRPLYELAASPEGPATACYSLREQRWRLAGPLPPGEHLTPVERLLPVPRRHEDGSVRFSATRARTVLMEEGRFYIYVVRNAVYTVSHLRAAHYRHAVELQGMDPVLAAAAARALAAPAPEGEAAAGGMAGAVDAAAQAVTRVIAGTTRLWRRKRA